MNPDVVMHLYGGFIGVGLLIGALVCIANSWRV